MFVQYNQEKNPFPAAAGSVRSQLAAAFLVLTALSGTAWGQAQDPAFPVNPPPVAPEVLDIDDTAGGTYLTFRSWRQWRILSVRSRLLRHPRGERRPDEDEEDEAAVTAAGGADETLSAALPAEAIQAEPAAAVSSGAWTLWSVVDLSRVKDVRTAFRKRGHATGITAGLERSLGTAVTLGASVSYLRTKQTTVFNGGRSRIHGLTVTPYVSIMPVEWLNLTVSGGYVHNRERLSWTSAGALASGSRHSSGYAVVAVAEASRWFDTLLLTGRTGVSASKDSWRPFVDSLGVQQPALKERVVQWTVEAGAALWLEPVMPFLNVAYTRDLKKVAQETDRDDFTINGGLSWYGSGAYQNVSADLSGTVILGRKSQRNYTLSLGLRISF